MPDAASSLSAPAQALDVVHAAWIGYRSPAPPGLAEEGSCACCGRFGKVQPVRTALTKKFASFDGWIRQDGGVCPACLWSYTTVSLRLRPQLVTRGLVAVEELTLPRLREILGDPVGPEAAISVPLHPERNKHVLPLAQWGRLVADDAVVAWTAADAGLLHVLGELRDLGVSMTTTRTPRPVAMRWASAVRIIRMSHCRGASGSPLVSTLGAGAFLPRAWARSAFNRSMSDADALAGLRLKPTTRSAAAVSTASAPRTSPVKRDVVVVTV